MNISIYTLSDKNTFNPSNIQQNICKIVLLQSNFNKVMNIGFAVVREKCLGTNVYDCMFKRT